MPNNLGLQYKSGLGSCLQQGYRNFSSATEGIYFNPPSSVTQFFYQQWGIRISGVNQSILNNEPFIFTQRIMWDVIVGNTGGNGIMKGTNYYRGDTNGNSFTLCLNQDNDSIIVFRLSYANSNGLPPQSYDFFRSRSIIKRNVPYNLLVYKDNSSITSATSYRVYINGVYQSTSYANYPAGMTIPTNVISAITFNEITFGAHNQIGTLGGTNPSKIFNNSVFKVETGLTTSYIDEVALQLHRVDNYIHLLPSSYTIVNPSNVLYYFPLYLKEGKDIRNYYNPTKKYNVRLTFGAGITLPPVDFKTGSTVSNGIGSPVSVYKGPYNIWRKPYPPYDPYI